jgi:hypothetical protein
MRRAVLQFFGLLALIGAGAAVLFCGFWLSFNDRNCAHGAKADCHVPLVLGTATAVGVALLAVGLVLLRIAWVLDQRRPPVSRTPPQS